jgi:hypothetical protein
MNRLEKERKKVIRPNFEQNYNNYAITYTTTTKESI